MHDNLHDKEKRLPLLLIPVYEAWESNNIFQCYISIH